MGNLVKELLLTSTGYWVLNKRLVKELGLQTAFFLSNLAEAETMLADEDGWFYQTIQTVEEVTTLSRYEQDKCIKKLIDLGILEVDKKGLPAKRYFRLNYDKIVETLEIKPSHQIVKNSQTRMQETNKLECQFLTTNKEHTYKESKDNKEHNNKESMQDKITKKEIDLIIDTWNEVREGTKIPRVISINPSSQRYKSLNARYKEYGLEELLRGIRLIKRSRFLQGENNRNWTITLDWYIKPNNIIKVLEGNYTDTKETPRVSPNIKPERVKEELATDEDGDIISF